jgi:hypothetical protein
MTAAEWEHHPPVAVEQQRVRYLVLGYHGPRWTAYDLALLGTLPDDQVARRNGSTLVDERVTRTRLGTGMADDKRKRKLRQ